MGSQAPKPPKATIRWKVLHHDRLGALDVGDLANEPNRDSFKEGFVNRTLTDFPCLTRIPFVSTSDAYSLDSIGKRFTWIRLESPTIEGLRQAFLDYEARIACDWDPRFARTERTPNVVDHAWVERIRIERATTVRQSLEITFNPRLNILIGGRGSGKSTVVVGLRSLYGDSGSLPSQIEAEANNFRDNVLQDAQIDGVHHLAHSGEGQAASWTRESGSLTQTDEGTKVGTSFGVRVVSQKELFERAAVTANDPHAASRSLLSLVDEALKAEGVSEGSRPGDHARVEKLRAEWVSAAMRLQQEEVATARREQVASRVQELTRQVAAFDSESSRLRRETNDLWLEEAANFEAEIGAAGEAIEYLVQQAQQIGSGSARVSDTQADDPPQRPRAPRDDVRAVLKRMLQSVGQAAALAREELAQVESQAQTSPWRDRVRAAEDDARAYTSELAAMGLDLSAYEAVRSRHASEVADLRDLDMRIAQLPGLESARETAWAQLQEHLARHKAARMGLLSEIAGRSGMLRFGVSDKADLTDWVTRIRELLSLRSDGFVEEVPALARWIWNSGDPEREVSWRQACISGQFEELSRQAGLRQAWAARLAGLDAMIRTRLASEVPFETVSMEFLRDENDPSSWEPLTSGSPGQRSAAMLSFMLHHGSLPLVLDQPEDDLDTEWISQLVVRQLRKSRWSRQVIVVTHNANIPVNADAERVIVLENRGGGIRVRSSVVHDEEIQHCGPVEVGFVREDIQQIMEGGVEAFVRREKRYNNELNSYRAALQRATAKEVEATT
jgi:DNA repair ATPase RecN